jgi:hypothetical protein
MAYAPAMLWRVAATHLCSSLGARLSHVIGAGMPQPIGASFGKVYRSAVISDMITKGIADIDCGRRKHRWSAPGFTSLLGEAMVKILASVLGVLIAGCMPASAELLWCWRFAGAHVSAAGTFTTSDDADAGGFYRIVDITGTTNSASITELQPTGTSIPGNSGYPVDNLISATAPQLTKHGFGFMTSDGAYHNPFRVTEYRDYISRPPYADGKGAEPTIQFNAVAAASGSDCSAK